MSQLRPRVTRHKFMFERWERPVAGRESLLRFGDYGLKVVGRYDLKDWKHTVIGQNALQAVQAKLQKILRETDSSDGKRVIKTWRNVFPHMSYTRKPAETKMGKGKGAVAGFVAVCRRGQIIFEWTSPPDKVTDVLLEKIVKECSTRLPIMVKLVRRPQFQPPVPLAVEKAIQIQREKRRKGEIERPTNLIWARTSNALEDYVAELPEEERQHAINFFRQKVRKDQVVFRHFNMPMLLKHNWRMQRLDE